MEILETEGGDWKIWRGVTAEISQYLASSCLTLTEVCKNILQVFSLYFFLLSISNWNFQSRLLMADSGAVRGLDLESLELEEIARIPEGKVAANIKCVFLKMKPSEDLGVYYFSGGWFRSVE